MSDEAARRIVKAFTTGGAGVRLASPFHRAGVNRTQRGWRMRFFFPVSDRRQRSARRAPYPFRLDAHAKSLTEWAWAGTDLASEYRAMLAEASKETER